LNVEEAHSTNDVARWRRRQRPAEARTLLRPWRIEQQAGMLALRVNYSQPPSAAATPATTSTTTPTADGQQRR
jgi:hypothetical protein